MTRGGVSKATRGFHISEDVFAGYEAFIRGGTVKFREYISVGKGRDMGFDSINSFESKVRRQYSRLIEVEVWEIECALF